MHKMFQEYNLKGICFGKRHNQLNKFYIKSSNNKFCMDSCMKSIDHSIRNLYQDIITNKILRNIYIMPHKLGTYWHFNNLHNLMDIYYIMNHHYNILLDKQEYILNHLKYNHFNKFNNLSNPNKLNNYRYILHILQYVQKVRILKDRHKYFDQ